MTDLLLVRDARVSDIAQMAAIERVSFPDPWSESMLHGALGDRHQCVLVAELGDVVGFAVAQLVYEHAQLFDIAVRPDVRGRGVGSSLLEALLARCRQRHVTSVTLEVRDSNQAARALYARFGFVEVGRRKGYYRSPVEDGLLLQANIPVSTEYPEKMQ